MTIPLDSPLWDDPHALHAAVKLAGTITPAGKHHLATGETALWLAMDSDNDWYVFTSRPTVDARAGEWYREEGDKECLWDYVATLKVDRDWKSCLFYLGDEDEYKERNRGQHQATAPA